MAKIFFQNSNYSCDDNVTNFVKFMKKLLKMKIVTVRKKIFKISFQLLEALYNIVNEYIKINKLVFP